MDRIRWGSGGFAMEVDIDRDAVALDIALEEATPLACSDRFHDAIPGSSDESGVSRDDRLGGGALLAGRTVVSSHASGGESLVGVVGSRRPSMVIKSNSIGGGGSVHSLGALQSHLDFAEMRLADPTHYVVMRDAVRAIEKWFIGIASRRCFALLKEAVRVVELSDVHEFIHQVSSADADLLHDAGAFVRLRLRFAGECFPPSIVFKFISAVNTCVLTGRDLIRVGTVAGRDAARMMGTSAFLRQQRLDNHRAHEFDEMDPTVDIASRRDYLTYIAQMDDLPVWLGGRGNVWRPVPYDTSSMLACMDFYNAIIQAQTDDPVHGVGQVLQRMDDGDHITRPVGRSTLSTGNTRITVEQQRKMMRRHAGKPSRWEAEMSARRKGAREYLRQKRRRAVRAVVDRSMYLSRKALLTMGADKKEVEQLMSDTSSSTRPQAECSSVLQI